MQKTPSRSATRTALSCTLVLGVVAAAACGEPQAPQMTASAPLSRARLVRMVREVQREVEALRGWKFKRPVKVDVRTEAQLRKFLLDLFDRDYGGGLLERKQVFLRMVGLVPPNADLRETFIRVLLNQIGGLYDHHSKSFYMMIREGIPYSDFVTRILVAHELTHALDDQYIDLEPFARPDLPEDTAFSYAAVVEGSATVLMSRYMLTLDAEHGAVQDLTDVLEAEMRRAEILKTVPRYFTALVANYVCGMHFLLHGNLGRLARPEAGLDMQKKVLRLAREPPASTEQILHPEKYWDASLRDDPVCVDDEPVRRFLEDSGRFVVHTDTVGELLCALLTQPADEPFDMLALSLPGAWTNEGAQGWGGDRFYLLARGRNREQARRDLRGLCGVWITIWDTPDDADEFLEDYQSYRDLPERAALRIAPRIVVFTFRFDAARRERLEHALRGGLLRLTRSGKPWHPDERP